MPRAYGEDLRWRAVWMTQVLGMKTEEVAIYLAISPRTIQRYISKFNAQGNVAPAKIGRPL